MKLSKKKINKLFEILDSILLKKYPKNKIRGFDFMLMGNKKNQSVIQYAFKHIETRDYLFMYYNTENYTIAIPETLTPFHKGEFLNQLKKENNV